MSVAELRAVVGELLGGKPDQDLWSLERELHRRCSVQLPGLNEILRLLSLTASATLELSREAHLTAEPTSESTCETAARPSEPSAEEIRVVKEALFSGPGWSCTTYVNGPGPAFLMARAAIRALDEYRALPSRTPR